MKLAWYVRRLRVMSLREILHRINEQIYLFYLRVFFEFNKQLSYKIYSAKEYIFCSTCETRLPILDWDFEPSSLEIKQWLAGNWPALNFPWRWEKDSDCWNIAPDKRNAWPVSFFNSINYRPGNSVGDVRIAWEPSRLQQLVALALVVQDNKFDRSKQAVDLIEAQLRNWLESNQYLAGINYISSMECALRIIAVCYALDIARVNIKPDSSVWNDLLRIVEGHACLIEKRLSLYSSSGNHTIAESVGLLYAGINFPEFKRANIWRKKALALLRDEADRQILSDGGSIEQSFWYLLFVSDLYGLADKLLDHSGSRDQKVQSAFERASEFLSTFASSPEQLPDIGDSDNGYALSKFLRISFKGVKKEIGIRTFEQSGYTLCNVTPNVSLIMDHGCLGMPPSFGHGHADCLSLLMSCGGEQVITDCGTYGYSLSQEWRKYFRGTSAHNTVTVDGHDQADYVNSFMWKDTYNPRLLLQQEDEAGFYMLASHDGYESIGVRCSRGIFINYQHGCFVWDRLDGAGNHSLILRWHLEVVTSIKNNKIFTNNDSIVLSIGGADEIKNFRGQLNPISGWKSNGYGDKEPISTIEANYYGKLPHEFNTYISWNSDSKMNSDYVELIAEKFREKISAS